MNKRWRPETAALLRRHLDSLFSMLYIYVVYSRAFSETGLLHRLDWAQIRGLSGAMDAMDAGNWEGMDGQNGIPGRGV